MADLYYGINQTGYSIMNQLSSQILYGLLDRLDALRYMGNAIFVTGPQRGISTVADQNKNVFVTTDRVDGKVSYILDPKSVPWPSINNYSQPGVLMSDKRNVEYPKIWEDKQAGVCLRERATPAALDYDLTLTLQTEDAAIRVFDQIKRLIIGDVININFDINYGYPVTTYIFKFFYNAWILRNHYRDQPLMTYINAFAKERITYDMRKSQIACDHPDIQLFIRRQQIFCQAKLACDATQPEPSMVNNAVDCYTIPLSFQIQFARPFELIGTMPIVIDNQFVDPTLFDRRQITSNQNVNSTITSEWQRGFFRKWFPGFLINHDVMIIPPYDETLYSDTVIHAMKFAPFLQVAFTLDGATTEIDLKNIDGIGLHPIVKDIMLAEKADIFDFEGLFNIRVFADDIPLNKKLLSLSDDMVLTVGSAGTDKRYHLVISEATLTGYLNKQYYADLLKYRYFFPMTITRNLKYLMEQHFFTIDRDNHLVATIQYLMNNRTMYAYIDEWIANGETTEETYQYCSNAAQLADYLSNTISKNQTATPTSGTPQGKVAAQAYTASLSPGNLKTLYNTFIATGIANQTIDPSDVPTPYLLVGNGYPYTTTQETYYGFPSPLRVIAFGFECQQRTQ